MQHHLLLTVAVLFNLALAPSLFAAESFCELVEADWLLQAKAWMPDAARQKMRLPGKPHVRSCADAAGAVDGIKNGTYGFHTDREPNPWWQVDLGKPQPIGRIVVYNRLDYAPGLHNADNLAILTSNDGKQWTRRYENRKHFGGIKGEKPMTVEFKSDQLVVRFVRLQLPSDKPVWFHLDEVEVYGEDAKANLALNQSADQSSISQWSTDKLAAKASAEPALSQFPMSDFVGRARRLAADLRASGVDTQAAERELNAVEDQWKVLAADAPLERRKQLYFQARWAARRLAFLNPALNFRQLVLVKRFTQETYPDVCLNHMPWVSRPGGDICVVTLGGPDGEPQVRNLLDGRLGPGHVHGMDLWWDADRVVFGYAKAKSDQPVKGFPGRLGHQSRLEEEPTHLFEIGIDGQKLRQLTDHHLWSDLDPTYLPSGDIAFASERCGASLQCNEMDKDETSCNLYIMRPDGSNIRRLSVTKDGDYLPHCLDDGTIGYTRWEYEQRGWAHIQSLWTVRPDGTGADAWFKQHLNDPWALEDFRSIPGTSNNKLVAIATGHHTLAAGPVTVITPSDGMNDPRAIRIVTPGVSPPEGGMSGTAVAEGGTVDDGGFYMTPWPLSEKCFLASYSYSANQTERAGYGIYLIDVFGTKELVYRDPAISSFVPIPLQPRPKPPVLPDVTAPETPYAVCSLSAAAFKAPGIESKRARYLRIVQGIQWPYTEEYGGERYEPDAKGTEHWNPARVIGTVRLEDDGSAHFKVPADEAVYFQLLDENQMELRRMRSFISFQPGEQRACVGCHETNAVAPPGVQYPLALRSEPVEPVPPPWGTVAMSFLRDVQPIFDKHCVECHRGLQPAAGLDFSGGLTSGPRGRARNAAYDTIFERQLIARSNVSDDAQVTMPLAFGSHRSKLVQVLREGACGKRAKLSEEEWLRLVTWIDLNGPYHDRFINKRAERQPYDLSADRNLEAAIQAVHEKRCQACHKPAEISRLSWIDLKKPAQSLFLVAPLARTAGGTQRCSQAIYSTASDPDYRELLKLVHGAVEWAWEHPRRDLMSISGDRAAETERQFSR